MGAVNDINITAVVIKLAFIIKVSITIEISYTEKKYPSTGDATLDKISVAKLW